MNFLASILGGIITGKAGEQLGGAVSYGAQIAAILAAIAPCFLWLTHNKDAVFITLTYGDLAFWGVVFGGQLLLVLRLVHRAPQPQ